MCGAVDNLQESGVVICAQCGRQLSPRSPGAKAFLLDSNAYDKVVETDEIRELVMAACAGRQIELLMTHVQEDELRDIADAAKRARVGSLPSVVAATEGFIIDVSWLGSARVSESKVVEDVRNDSHRHSRDALLASTAAADGAVLVTADKRLRNFATRSGVEVWSPDDFLAFIRTLARQDGGSSPQSDGLPNDLP
jgi:predicted nucleic acid-binding protein